METLSWRGVLAQLFLNSIPCWHNKELLHCKGTTVCKHLALMNNCRLKVESTLKNVDRCLLTCFLMSYEHSTKMILIHFITFETILTITHKLCESNHTPHRMKTIIWKNSYITFDLSIFEFPTVTWFLTGYLFPDLLVEGGPVIKEERCGRIVHQLRDIVVIL